MVSKLGHLKAILDFQTNDKKPHGCCSYLGDSSTLRQYERLTGWPLSATSVAVAVYQLIDWFERFAVAAVPALVRFLSLVFYFHFLEIRFLGTQRWIF